MVLYTSLQYIYMFEKLCNAVQIWYNVLQSVIYVFSNAYGIVMTSSCHDIATKCNRKIHSYYAHPLKRKLCLQPINGNVEDNKELYMLTYHAHFHY